MQDSLPAAGPALPDGVGYPQGFSERFHIWLIPLSRASLAQCKPWFAELGRNGRVSSQVSQFAYLPKSKEGQSMPFRKSPLMDSTGVEGMTEGWGKIVARRVYEQVSPGLDLDADDIEQVTMSAARAVAKGAIEELLEKKASLLGTERPCPGCGKLCPIQRDSRSIHFWGTEVPYLEPKCHCSACRRDFFPSVSKPTSDIARL